MNDDPVMIRSSPTPKEESIMTILSFDEVKDLIEGQLAGSLPTSWAQGWSSAAGGVPMNPISSHEFTGMNYILGFVLGNKMGSVLWATQTQFFEEAKKKNGFFAEAKKRGVKNSLLKRGEDGRAVTPTTFVKPVFKKTEIEKSEAETLRSKGKGGSVKEETFKGVTKYYLQMLLGFEEYKVFNLSQVNPLLREMIEKRLGIGVDAVAKSAGEFGEMVKKMGIEVVSGRPAYLPMQDKIQMPPSEAFVDDQNYMGVLAHEVGHWTGHASRMNRETLVKNVNYGSDIYAEEEAVAEWFAVLACAHFGLIKGGSDTVNNAAYIKGWTSRFSENPGLINQTFKQAEKAFRWFLKTAAESVGVKITVDAVAAVGS